MGIGIRVAAERKTAIRPESNGKPGCASLRQEAKSGVAATVPCGPVRVGSGRAGYLAILCAASPLRDPVAVFPEKAKIIQPVASKETLGVIGWQTLGIV